MNIVLCVGAILGLISVLAGAYSDHVVNPQNPAQSEHLLIALRYLQTHAVLIAALGFSLWCPLPRLIRARLQLSAWIFAAGTTLFSLSLILAVALELPELLNITPVGGFLLIFGWISLVWAALGDYKPIHVTSD